jgi:hypothetical protein
MDGTVEHGVRVARISFAAQAVHGRENFVERLVVAKVCLCCALARRSQRAECIPQIDGWREAGSRRCLTRQHVVVDPQISSGAERKTAHVSRIVE